jgi:vanillate O-demethylase monooxygenase subunit
MLFAADGRCVRVPGEAAVPTAACARAYPTVERYGIVWFWPGDPAAADEALLPAIPEYDDPAWTAVQGTTLHFACNWLLLADNLLDPAHTSFVHRSSVGNAAGEEVPPRLVPAGERIGIGRWVESAPPVPVMERFATLPSQVDRWQFYYFQFPGTGWVDFGAIPAGAPRDDATRNAHFRTQTIQLITPETDATTHYFWFHLRTFSIGDAAVSAAIRESWAATFEEDRALLATVQRNEERYPDLPRARIGIDAATVRMRALLAKRLAAETAMDATRPAVVHA